MNRTLLCSVVAVALIITTTASANHEILKSSSSSGHVETVAAPDTRTFRQSIQGAEDRMDGKPSFRFQESDDDDGKEEASNQGEIYNGFPEGFLDGLESAGSSKSLPKDDSGFYEAPAHNFPNFVDFAERQHSEDEPSEQDESTNDRQNHQRLPSTVREQSSDHLPEGEGSFQSPLGKENWGEGFLDNPVEEDEEENHSPAEQAAPRQTVRKFGDDYKDGDDSYNNNNDDDDEWYDNQGSRKSSSARFVRDDRSQSRDKEDEQFYQDEEDSPRMSARFHRDHPSHRGFRQVSFLHPAFGGFFRGQPGGIFAFPPRHSNRPHQAAGNHLHAKPSNILGSGNFGIIRGGIFSDDDMPSRDTHGSNNYHDHNPHNFFQGFQDFQPFIGPINNALSNNEHHVANPPQRVASGSHVTPVLHSSPAPLTSSTTAAPTTHKMKASTTKL